MEISLCGPQSFQPDEPILKLLKDNNLSPTWTFTSDPDAGAVGADAVLYRCMGEHGLRRGESGSIASHATLPGKRLHLQLNQRELSLSCIVCPPILKKKSTQSVLDSQRAILFDQAENRLHMQKAILSALSPHNFLKR